VDLEFKFYGNRKFEEVDDLFIFIALFIVVYFC
jgi:hypothetical protein